MKLPSPKDVVTVVRARVPWLASPQQPDSPLPYVARRPTINPVLPVADMARATAFYRALGFVVDQYDAGYAWVKNCSWEIVHLAATAGGAAPVGPAGAYVHVDDPDTWHAALSASAEPDAIGELADQPWGMREFEVTDPDGNTIRFGCNVG